MLKSSLWIALVAISHCVNRETTSHRTHRNHRNRIATQKRKQKQTLSESEKSETQNSESDADEKRRMGNEHANEKDKRRVGKHKEKVRQNSFAEPMYLVDPLVYHIHLKVGDTHFPVKVDRLYPANYFKFNTNFVF